MQYLITILLFDSDETSISNHTVYQVEAQTPEEAIEKVKADIRSSEKLSWDGVEPLTESELFFENNGVEGYLLSEPILYEDYTKL